MNAMDVQSEWMRVSLISEAEKAQFLDLVRQGLNRKEASETLGYRGRHFRALTSPKSPYYDEEFARSYGETIGSLEHEQYRLERLRGAAFERAMKDSDRLLEKLLMIYDPDWAVLREKQTNVDVTVLIQRRFRELPDDKLDQLIGLLEEAAAEETVDAEVAELELPPAGDP